MTTPAKTPQAPTPRADKPFGWRFTTPLLLGSTLNPINSSLIATGLVGIGVDFHTGPGQTASLISVLYLCSAVMQPTMGKLSTLFGPRRVFLAGIGILCVAGVIGTTAPAFGFLLVSRALIGIGTSAAYPTAMALVRKRADDLKTGVPSRTLGNFSIASQITAVIGLPLGGVLTGVFGWRALFFVNVPLALLAFVFTLVGVPADESRPRSGATQLLAALDLPGIVLFAGAITGTLLFLSELSSPAWWLAAVSAVLIVGFILWERRVGHPLIDVRMLARNAPLQRTYLRQMFTALGIYAIMYGASQWMEQSAHLGATAVGLILLPLSGASIIVARVVSTRGWIRWPLITGAIAMILAAGVMLLISRDSNVMILIGMTLLIGLTNGFSGFANQATLYVQTPAAEIAVASGLYRTFGYFGAIFSASLIGIVFGSAATDSGLHALGWVLGAIGILLAALTVFDRRIPRSAHA
ncbi:MAG TPA: MFS transporter [Microbacteriaceae bacterium]